MTEGNQNSQPIIEVSTGNCLSERWQLPSSKVKNSIEKIQAIIDKYHGELHERLLELDREYPPASARTLRASADPLP